MSDTAPEDWEARLPARARTELKRLRRNLHETQQRVAALDTGVGRVVVDPYRHDIDGGTALHFPDRTPVRFELDDGIVDVSLRDGALYVSAANGGLVTFPSSTNVLHIRVGDWNSFVSGKTQLDPRQAEIRARREAELAAQTRAGQMHD